MKEQSREDEIKKELYMFYDSMGFALGIQQTHEKIIELQEELIEILESK